MTATTTRPRPARGTGAARGGDGGDGRGGLRRQRLERRRRLVWPLLAVVTVIGIVFIGVYPTRTWFAQRSSLRDATRQLQVLQQQNASMAEQIKALDTDPEIQRLAREKYNLVLPGEESYAINPAPPPPVAVPAVWPFTALARELAPAP